VLVALEQLAVGADVGDAPLLQEGDAVGHLHGRRPVRDDQARRRREHPPQRGLDERLGVDVERRERVVEHESPTAHREAETAKAHRG